MTVILVTGMSGTGKSAALDRLAQRGYRAVDTDFGGWIDDTGTEPLWREDRIGALIAEHELSGEPLLRSSATVQIDTRKPLDDVVDQLVALVY